MSVLWLHAALALVGLLMLLRQVLRFLALRARRAQEDGESRPIAQALMITGVNAVLALLILGVAVKGLVGVLIRR